jgi:hypothetical protein
VAPSSSPFSSTIFPFTTLRIVIPVKRIFLRHRFSFRPNWTLICFFRQLRRAVPIHILSSEPQSKLRFLTSNSLFKERASFALVHRLLNPLGFVAFKMGRLRGARKEHI